MARSTTRSWTGCRRGCCRGWDSSFYTRDTSQNFKHLLGTTCSLTWREAGEKERLWVCNPGHPITHGIDRYSEIPQEEMYGEPFAIPAPDETVFVSWFQGDEVFRSGCTWKRGNGKIFYFRPGHETYPTYHQKEVQLVIQNSVRWARPEGSNWIDTFPTCLSKRRLKKSWCRARRCTRLVRRGFVRGCLQSQRLTPTYPKNHGP